MADERGGAKQELSAANRDAQDDDAGSDGVQPLQAARLRRNGQIGALPRIESGAGFCGGDGLDV